VTMVKPDVQVNEMQQDEVAVDLEELSLQERADILFRRYATGRQGKTKMFLRKPDLQVFVADALRLRQRVLTEEAWDLIERIYERTLELQVDMGCSQNHGIISEYFHVFASEAVNILGLTLGTLVKELQSWLH